MTTTSYNIYQQITSVRLASTANIAGNYFNGALNNGVGATLTALTEGHLLVDGVLVEVGDRLLLKDQTDTNQNGLYVVQTTGSVMGLWMLERAPDFQSLEQLKVGQYFSVGAGNTFEGSMYVLVEPLPSTIGMGTFHFTNVADGAIPSGPYLLKANNLSDLSNGTTAFENLGLGRPGILVLTDADFAAGGGTYLLTNPPPIYVSMSTTSPGRVLQLPPQNAANSLQESQNITLLTGNPSQSININNGAGTLIFQVDKDSAWQAIPNDRSTVAGAWEFFGIVQNLNGVTGHASLTSNDGSVVITPDTTNQTVDLSAGPSVIGGTENIVWVGKNGSDVTGTGTFDKPYATLSHAMVSITTASSSNPFKIEMGDGVFSDTNLALKPWIFVDGNNCQYSVSGSVTLDSSWSSGGYFYFQNFFNLAFPAIVTLDFNAVGSPFSLINFTNIFETGSTLLSFVGQNTSGSIVIISNCINLGGSWIYHITNCYGAINGGDSGNIHIVHNSETAGGNFNIQNMTIEGNLGSVDTTAAGMDLFVSSSNVIGTTDYSSNGSGTVSVFQKGVTNLGGLTLDNGTGGGQVNLSVDILKSLPNLLNGATYNPDTIADAVKANAYFSPTNFTPASGPPGEWTAESVTGYFAGIDSALAVADNIPAAFGEMYFQGNTTPTTIASPATPVKVNATYNSGILQNFSHVSGTLTYTGVESRNVYVSADLTATYAGTSQNTSFYITLNGSVVAKSKQSTFIGSLTPANQSNPCQCMVPMVNGDTLELWVSNDDNTNSPIVTDCNFSVQSISAVGVIPPRQVSVLGTTVIPTGDYTSSTTTSVWQTLNGTNVVAANSLGVGQTVELTSTGVIASTVGGGTGFLQFKFGSLFTVNCQTISLTGNYQTPFELRVRITRSSTNNIIASTSGYYNDNSLTCQVLRMVIDPYTIAYDASIDNALTLTWTPLFTPGNTLFLVAANLNIIQYN